MKKVLERILVSIILFIFVVAFASAQVKVTNHSLKTDYLGGEYVYSLESELLGTAGAFKKMEEELQDNFFVINGDTITNVSLNDLFSNHIINYLINQPLVTIFTHQDAIHTGGVYVFNKRVLDFIPKNKFYSIKDDLIPDLIKRKEKIKLVNYFGTFYIDCGTPEGLKKARRFLKNEEIFGNLSSLSN